MCTIRRNAIELGRRIWRRWINWSKARILSWGCAGLKI